MCAFINLYKKLLSPDATNFTHAKLVLHLGMLHCRSSSHHDLNSLWTLIWQKSIRAGILTWAFFLGPWEIRVTTLFEPARPKSIWVAMSM